MLRRSAAQRRRSCSPTAAPFQSVSEYPRWKDQIATPAPQRYLGGQSDLATGQRELRDDWTQVSGG